MQSHLDVAVHGRKGLFMMSECKRILNKEVAGEGLWQTDLSKCQGQQEGEVLEIHPAGEDAASQDKRSDDDDKDDEVDEHSDVEEKDTDAEMPGTAEHADGEDINADAEMPGATEHLDGEAMQMPRCQVLHCTPMARM